MSLEDELLQDAQEDARTVEVHQDSYSARVAIAFYGRTIILLSRCHY